MAIVNKGKLNSADVYQRSLANDWPTAAQIYTTDIVEGDNLYYTNVRVQSYLDDAGIGATDLSGNTTTDLAEGNNLYYTNVRVQSYLNEVGFEPTANIIANVSVSLAIDLSGNTTTDLTEGDNLYYTNTRVASHVATLGYASTSYVDSEVANLVASAPAALDTLNELAAALGDDENFASNVISLISTKADIVSLTTANVSELNNLYYTNARVDSYINDSITTTDIDEGDNLYYTNARVDSYINDSITTTDIDEGDNLYYTNARVQAYLDDNGISGGGANLAESTTTDLAEGNNLYYTNARVLANLAESNIQVQTITTSGRLGVGTSSPAYQVEIENTGQNALLVLDRTDGAACFIEGQATRSAFGSVGATPLALAYNSAAVILIGQNGAITVNPDGDGFTFPTTDGTADQILVTDGAGNVYWANGGAGGTDLTGNTTTDLAEGNNLYYTNARVGAYLTEQGVGGSNTSISGGVSTSITRVYYGDNVTIEFAVTEGVTANNLLVFENGVAQLPVTDYTVSGNVLTFSVAPETNVLIQIRELEGSATINVGNVSLENSTTTELAEGDNLYYTNSRVQAYLDDNGISGGGANLAASTTTDLAEGDNLYYTNSRVASHVATLGYATESYVNSEVANLISSAPEALDTLNELAAALGDDENFASNVISLISTKADTASLTTSNVAELTNLYYTNARVLAHLAESNVSAQSFIATGAGTPTLTSQTNLVLSANADNGGAVVIQSSPLRIKTYTETDRGNITPATGDLIFNSTSNLLQVYNQVAWANVGSGVSGGVTEGANISANTTTDLAEGNNLYYTNARVAAHIDTLGYANDSDLTTANVAELTNLYYTNARVQAYLDGEGISGGGGGANLAESTTTDLAEGDNLYYTNARARSAFTAGSGILINNGTIAADVNIPSEQSFDITVDNTEMSIITDSLETAFTVSSDTSYRHILKSLILTNISQTDATINANLVYSGTEYEVANSLSIPYGFAVDLRFNPEVIMPGTSYKFQASANDTVSLFATYKTLEDISFISQTTSLVSDTYSTIYNASDADIVIESIKVMNHEGTVLRGTLQVKNSSDEVVSYLAANTLLAANYPSELLDNSIRLPLGYKLSFIQFSGRGTAIVSGRKSEAYTITSNVETISEGQSVTFTIATINIPDGATRYYRTSGNVSADDFTTGNTGSFTVLNDTATVTLTANLDQSVGTAEAGEQFQLVLAKTSTTGSAVATSNVISIIDTSNIVGLVSSTLSSNAIFETEAVVFTVNAVNGEGNNAGTFYYSVAGNAAIYGANTGSFIINDNIANIEIIAEVGVPVGGYSEFALQLRQDSVAGTIQQTTDYVKVYSSQITGMSATGGNQILEIDI